MTASRSRDVCGGRRTLGIGRVLGELGTGVIELAPAGVMGEDLLAPEREVAWMRKLSAETGRPINFGCPSTRAEG